MDHFILISIQKKKKKLRQAFKELSTPQKPHLTLADIVLHITQRFIWAKTKRKFTNKLKPKHRKSLTYLKKII